MAKTVVVRLDGELALVVVPAPTPVHMERLARNLQANSVELPTEAQFASAFPGCDAGAMPPFGNLFGMPVYVSPGLARADTIAFAAGSYTQVIELAYDDFERLVKPRHVDC